MRGVALALLEQLYLQSSTPPDEVRQLENRAAKGEQIPFREIVSTLSAVSKRFQRCYIVVDALDECASDYQLDLLHLLTSTQDSRSRLFATSRPFQSFEIFNADPSIPITPSKEDVELYVKSRLDRDLKFRDHPALFDEVVAVISERSARHGM